MHNDRVAPPEIPPRGAAGSCFVWTPITVAVREVTVPVPLDLLGLRVPVVAVSYSAEFRNITVKIGDRPEIGVVPVVVVGSTSITVSLSVSASVVMATVVRLRSCLRSNLNSHSGDGLVKMTASDAGGYKDGLVRLIAIESIEGRLGIGRYFLVLRNGGVSNRARSCSRKNGRPVLLRRRPARNVSGTMGSGWPTLPISIPEISAARARTYPDRRVVGSGSPGGAGEGNHRCE